MSLYSTKRVLVKLQDKNRSWYLVRDMDYLAKNTAELSQGRKDRYVGW